MNTVSLWWLLIVVIKIIYFVDANWITGNLCWSMPCMNGGSCFGSAYTYLCICPIHYTGALCEKRFGVCQENPCGNRGLCIEKSLTSFECRCYFDYMGSTCEEHVIKNGHNIWSSLLPVHTRILFDMLQEAYRAKAKEKSLSASDYGQIDFIGLLSAPTTTTTTSISIPMTSTTVETNFTTGQSETTEIVHVIQAHNIQLEKIFPNISTASTFKEFSEQSSQFDNSTTFETDMTTKIIENITTTVTEQIQSATDNQEIGNITEQSNIMITPTSTQWSNDNNTIDDMTKQDLIEETNNSTESVVNTTIKPIDFASSSIDITIDDDDKSYSSDQTITSPINTSEQPSTTDTTTISQIVHSQLLYKLCQQILHILPNISSSAAAAAALSFVSNSTSINNKTANVLLSWLSKHFSSSRNISTTSTVPSLMINKIRTSSIPLKRIEMDDVLHQMNNYIDSEH